jgi:hypothetical protein
MCIAIYMLRRNLLFIHTFKEFLFARMKKLILMIRRVSAETVRVYIDAEPGSGVRGGS